MLRSSRRSSSTPRVQGLNRRRSQTPTAGKDLSHRPAWDDTSTDLDKYKATPEQIERRKQQRVSKNMAGKDSSQRLSVNEWVKDQAQSPAQHNLDSYASASQSPYPALHLPASQEPTPASSAHPTPQGEKGSGSPPIDFSAVLKLLQNTATNAASSPPLTSTSMLLPAAQAGTSLAPPGAPAHAHESGAGAACDAEPETHWSTELLKASALLGLQNTQGLHAFSEDEPPLDATPDLGRMEIRVASGDPLPSSSDPPPWEVPAAGPEPNQTDLSSPAAASLQASKQRGAGVASGSRSPQVSDPRPGNATRWLDSDASMLASFTSTMHTRQQALEAQVARLEGIVQGVHREQVSQQQMVQGQQQQERQAGVDVMRHEVLALQDVCRQVRADQQQLRAEYDAFSQHAGALLTSLQTQIQQLLRSTWTAPVPQPPLPEPRLSLLQQVAHGTSSSLTHGAQGVPFGPGADDSADDSWLMRGLQGIGTEGAGPTTVPSSQSTLSGQGFRAREPPVFTDPPRVQPQPMFQPSRSLFQDVPASGRPAAAGPTTQLRADSIPLSNFDDHLALPSYAAMRRSGAGPKLTLNATAARAAAAQQHSPVANRVYGTGASSEGRDSLHADRQDSSAQHPGGQQGRSWPSQFQARTLGPSPILSTGLPAFSYDQPPAPNHLPPQDVLADDSRPAAHPGIGTGDVMGFRGTASSFGVLPEPMTFNLASDFKIVRLGGARAGALSGAGSGLTAENSLSLAAHTAAAAGGGGGGRARPGAGRR